MPWKPKIERFRQMVLWESNGLDPDLILALIKQESGGVIGKKARSTCRVGPISSIHGGSVIYDRALGLMQIVPGTIASYNGRHPNAPAYFEQMSGKTMTDARVQIRVGCGVLLHELKKLNDFYPGQFPGTTPATANTNQILCMLLAYRRGMGALIKKFKKLKVMGLALTYENIQEQFPLWGYRPPNPVTGEPGQWINRVLHYVKTIWTAALNHGMVPGAPVDNIPGPGIPETQIAGSSGGLVALAAIVVGLLLIGSRR